MPTSNLSHEDQVTLDREIDVLGDVGIELAEGQLKKWGTQDHDDYAWLLILTEEMGEVADAMLNARGDMMSFSSEEAFITAVRQLGQAAKVRLESQHPDRATKPLAGHGVDHELVQTAAVAVAFIENRRRRGLMAAGLA